MALLRAKAARANGDLAAMPRHRDEAIRGVERTGPVRWPRILTDDAIGAL
ncbi:hypothetical protein [Lentzea flava]|nr:hypothetical protein [Lentzea flava]